MFTYSPVNHPTFLESLEEDLFDLLDMVDLRPTPKLLKRIEELKRLIAELESNFDYDD